MRFVPSTVFGVAVATLVLSSGVASAQTFRCDVVHDRTRFVTDTVGTTSTAFRNLSGTAVAVTQSSNNCLIIVFSGQINAENAIEFRLTRDGIPVGFPGLINVATVDRSDNRTIRFLVPPNADNIGRHVYALDFRSEDGKVVAVSRFMTTVYFPE
jgi:hypothetical protein